MNYSELRGLAMSQEWASKLKREVEAENLIILAKRQAQLDTRTSIKQGDFVAMPDKSYRRIAHVWEDVIQLASGGDFYLGRRGGCSYSGGLDSGLPRERFRATEEKRLGSVWFFSQDTAQAHNGYYCDAVFPVWLYQE